MPKLLRTSQTTTRLPTGRQRRKVAKQAPQASQTEKDFEIQRRLKQQQSSQRPQERSAFRANSEESKTAGATAEADKGLRQESNTFTSRGNLPPSTGWQEADWAEEAATNYPSAVSLRQQQSRRVFGLRGLWGRKPASSPQNPVPRSGRLRADDWAENQVQPPEKEDGWGNQEPSPEASANRQEDLQDQASGPGEDPPAEESEAVSNDVPFSEEELPDPQPEPGVAEVLEDPEDFEETEADDGPYPDITLLPPREVDELVPIVPSAEQLGASWGTAVEVWQRLGAAAFLTIITAKLNMVLFASGSATYPFWGPAFLAANRNRVLRSNGRHVGFWRTSVLSIEVERPQRRRYTDRTISGAVISQPVVRFLLGDDSGARSQLVLPFNRRYEQVVVGEPAELLVLSMHSRFDKFKALKEVYLPVSGLWLSEYPHVTRNLFLEISLDIERTRKRERMEGAVEAVF